MAGGNTLCLLNQETQVVRGERGRSGRAGLNSTSGMSRHPLGFGLATVGVFVPPFFRSVAVTMCWTALSERALSCSCEAVSFQDSQEMREQLCGEDTGQPGDYREHPWRVDWPEAGVGSLVKDCQLFDDQDLTDL